MKQKTSTRLTLEDLWALKVINKKYATNSKRATEQTRKRPLHAKVLFKRKSTSAVSSQSHLRRKAGKRVVGDSSSLKGTTRQSTRSKRKA